MNLPPVQFDNHTTIANCHCLGTTSHKAVAGFGFLRCTGGLGLCTPYHMYTSDTYINITYTEERCKMQDVTVNCEFVLGWVLGFGLWRALPLPCRYEVGDEVIEVMVASSNRCSCLTT